MNRSLVVSSLTLALTLGWVGSAAAAPKDDAAKKLQKEAINVHYLGTAFDKAIDTLKKGLETCGASGCSPQVVAELHRDIGMILVVGKKQPDEGKAEFQKAIAAFPAVKLDKDLSTDEVKKLFEEARKAAGAPPPAAAGGAAPPAGGAAAVSTAEGDLVHTPVTASQVRTPLPVYAELPEGVKAIKIVLHYRPFGAGWKQKEMFRAGDGFGIELPCDDFGVVGQAKYYIEALNSDGEIVAYFGSRRNPVAVAVGNSAPDEPPALPGKAPPAQCQEKSDCPPDFPGCSAGGGDGDKDEDMDEPTAPDKGKRLWVGLSVQQDLQLVESVDEPCSLTDRCYFSDGSGFPAIPLTDTQLGPAAGRPEIATANAGNSQSGGFALGMLRIKATFDYRLFGGFTVGAGAGVGLLGGPDAFIVHAEAKAAYQFFGYDSPGLKPFVAFAAGVAGYDARTTTSTYWCGNESGQTQPVAGNNQGLDSSGTCAAPNAVQQADLNVWNPGGIGFASLGGGLRYLINGGSVDHLPGLEVKYTAALPDFANVISVEAGYKIGF